MAAMTTEGGGDSNGKGESESGQGARVSGW
jgi:hypothetical protein